MLAVSASISTSTLRTSLQEILLLEGRLKATEMNGTSASYLFSVFKEIAARSPISVLSCDALDQVHLAESLVLVIGRTASTH